jgi:mRNA-degrading endonuclease RelE of RelBE toxin-antitoxin system
MAWTIEASRAPKRELRKLHRDTANHIVDYLNQLVVATTDQRQRGKGLPRPYSGLCRDRLGDHIVHRSRVYD